MFTEGRGSPPILAATPASSNVLDLWTVLFFHWTRNHWLILKITILRNEATALQHWLFVTRQKRYFTIYWDGQVSSWTIQLDFCLVLLTCYLPFPLGCCHDTRLWENSELNLKQRSLFSPGEYLIGDSGFPTSENLIPAFKRPNAMTKEKNSIST
jgi:hypothetical protein